MTDPNAASARVLELAEEFLARYRLGERPALGEYTGRYPDLADEIREVFPAMAMMERIALADGSIEGTTRRPIPPHPPRIGRLGDYRIIREIGHGGMGVVYEAEQVSLGRHVALKVLPERLLRDPRQRGRFEREARAAARLHHTNIVPVFGVGEDDGSPYYAMQYIPGLGLDQVLEELKRQRSSGRPPARAGEAGPGGEVTVAEMARSLSEGRLGVAPRRPPAATEAVGEGAGEDSEVDPGRDMPAAPSTTLIGLGAGGDAGPSGSSRSSYWRGIARIGAQAADALSYAHSEGVLHRDIKPSNLLLDGRGNVWVTDFGLAKVEDQEGLTATGDILGTLRYMPPEAFEGKHDARGDVYSLGLSLYEMLAFRPAFDETERGRLVSQVSSGKATRLRMANPDVPRDLETVVHKAIERDPAHRYPTAAALAEDLRRFVEDRPILARRASEVEKLRRWCRRNPAPAGLLATLFLVFWAGFVLVAWKWREAVAEREAKDDQRLKAIAAERGAGLARDRAEEERERALEAAGRAERSLYFARIARAQLEYQAGNIARSESILDSCDRDRRGWEWHFLKRLNRSEMLRLDGRDGWVHRVAYSPDGRLIATAGGGYPFFAVEAAHELRGGRAILWDAKTGRRLHEFDRSEHLVTNVEFSPDGRLLASAGFDGMVRLHKVASRQLAWAISVGGIADEVLRSGEMSVPLAFSPDGERLAVGRGDRSIALVDVATGLEVARLPASEFGYREATFSPDGRWIATASANAAMLGGAARVWDAATGVEAFTLESGHECARLCFGPDSRSLAGVSRTATVMIWGVPGGRVLRTLSGSGAEILALAFSPDGLRIGLAGRDGTVRLARLADGRVVRLIRGHTEAVSALAFGPDGLRLASGSRDGSARVWDLTEDPDVADVAVPPRNASIMAVAYDRDGGRIASVDRTGTLLHIDPATRRIDERDGVAPPIAALVPARKAVFDAEGRHLLVVPADRQREAVRIDASGEGPRVVLRGHTMPIRWAVLDDDGSRAATAAINGTLVERRTPGEVFAWDVGSGTILFRRVIDRGQPRHIALDPSGRLLAMEAVRIGPRPDEIQHYLAVYEVDTGREVFRHDPLPRSAWVLGFSPDGRRLAAASLDRHLFLFDVAARRLAVAAELGTAEVRDLAFSPDGSRLALASKRAIVLADSETGEEVLILRGQGHQQLNTRFFNPRVRFSPDGTRLLAVCDNVSPSLSEWSIAPRAPGPSPEGLPGAEDRRTAFLQQAMLEASDASDGWSIDLLAGRLERMPLGLLQCLDLGATLARHRRWDRAEYAFRRAAELAPGLDRVAYEAGNAFALQGEWTRAGAWYARLEGRVPRDVLRKNEREWMLHAGLRLLSSDAEGYRRLCREMAESFERLTRPDRKLIVARTCLLDSSAHDDPGSLVRLAMRTRNLVEDAGRKDLLPEALIASATARERAGRHPLAERLLREALALRPDPLMAAIGRARLAVVLLHQGRLAEARASLDESGRWSPPPQGPAREGSPPGFFPVGVRPEEWCELVLARRRAQALLLDAEFPADPFAR